MTAKQFLDHAVAYFQAPGTQTGWGKNKVAEKLKDLYIEAEKIPADPLPLSEKLLADDLHRALSEETPYQRLRLVNFLVDLAMRVRRLELGL